MTLPMKELTEARNRIAAELDGIERLLASELQRQRRELTGKLNQIARRLQQSEEREVWMRTLLEGAAAFCGNPAFLAVTPAGLRLEGAHGGLLPAGPEIPPALAPAVANAIEARDTVITAGTPRELSEVASSILGDASTKRVYLFPLVVRDKVHAVLYAEADSDSFDVSALELLASVASATLQAPAEAPRTSTLISIADAPARKAPARPDWSDLPGSDQQLHLKAQRFAKTRVAEIVLHKMEKIQRGRASDDLYGELREEIDAGRETFRRQFADACPSMVDYFHVELVRTLAKDDAAALGPDYPGPVPCPG